MPVLGRVAAGSGIVMSGGHTHEPAPLDRAFAVGVGLNLAFVATEAVFGVLEASTALLADAAHIFSNVLGLPGVTAVHDVHIWAMSTTETALTAHLVKQYAQDDDAIIAEATRALHSRFGIQHTTLRWERGPDACCPRLPG